MSKVLRTVAVVAAAVALVATGVGAVAAPALAATAASVAAAATVVSTAATLGAQITAPKPRPQGSVADVVIAVEPPRPYLIGETFFGGVVRYQAGYGATLKKVPNPYWWEVKVFSGVGPVDALVQEQLDFAPIGSYYTGFYASDTQLGARPESTALVPPYGAAPGWDSTSKLSGCAAIGSNYKFDRDGKVFAGGRGTHGAIWRGEKAYDPRLDSTRAGGSGSHRVNDETTWAYTANPALHAGTYAYGRFQSGKKIFGIGISDLGIDWAAIAAWANDCDTNGWEASGVIFEGGPDSGPELKARNLDDICAAGAGRWLMAGAVLTFDLQRPRLPLGTITDSDVKTAIEIITLQSQRDRFNTVPPQFTDPDANWQRVTAEPIIGSTYVTEDGESKAQVWPLNMVKDATQAGQVAAYALTDSREMGPITVTLKAEWRHYKPGDCLRIESAETGLESDAVIIGRSFDPATLEVTFTFKSETEAKHDFALGKVAVAPPTPIIGMTGQQRDGIAVQTINPRGINRVRNFTPSYPVTPGDGEIVIVAFDATLEDGRTISLPAETWTGLDQLSIYMVIWDLVDEEYILADPPATTFMESNRYVFVVTTTTSDGTTFPTPDPPPDGWYSEPNTVLP